MINLCKVTVNVTKDNATKEPIVGAWFVASDGKGIGHGAQSDSSGHATLTGYPGNWTWLVQVVGRMPQSSSWNIQKDSTFNIALHQTYSAEMDFKVTDVKSKPIKDATIFVTDGAFEKIVKSTDQNGLAHISGIPGRWDMEIVAHGFLTYRDKIFAPPLPTSKNIQLYRG